MMLMKTADSTIFAYICARLRYLTFFNLPRPAVTATATA